MILCKYNAFYVLFGAINIASSNSLKTFFVKGDFPMSRMTQTNYWNKRVNYIGKNSAQNFMKSAKAKVIGAGVKVVAADCSCNCSSGCSACSSSCGSCTSCSTSCS